MTIGPIDIPTAAICARIESPKCVGTKGAGWLHRLRDDDWRRKLRTRRFSIDTPAEPAINFDALAVECESALGPHRRGLLVKELGVSVESLSRLQVGWSEQHRSYTCPRRDADGKTCGIRLRCIDGSKWAMKGSRQGLFLPRHSPLGHTLVVCEGPTDTAALLMLCFDAVGRPSCTGGVELLIELLLRHQPHDVAIVADADTPGQHGARDLASRLVGYVPGGVRVVTPPVGVKDAREWMQQRADRLDILNAIEAASALTLNYSRRALV